MADEPDDPDRPADTDRRSFLKVATCGIGGAMGIAIAVPAARALIHPVDRRIVVASSDPIDIGPLAQVPADGTPTKLTVIAPALRDAWTAATDVPLGIAWLRRDGDRVTAISGICPHLGCQVAFDGAKQVFACPCHDSAFAATGDRLTGPAKRGLDPLPVAVENGRLRLTWIRFKPDIPGREPA